MSIALYLFAEPSYVARAEGFTGTLMLPLLTEPGYGVPPESGAIPPLFASPPGATDDVEFEFDAPVEPALLPEPVAGPIWIPEPDEPPICGEYPYPDGAAGSVRTMEVYGDWPGKVGVAVSTTVVGVPTAVPGMGTSTGVGFPGTKEYP